MEQEIWKPIKGYEGIYEVSSFGRIKSISRKRGFIKGKTRILKPIIKDNGYAQINLYKDNIYTRHYIHRIVAQEFIQNKNNLPCINHKDYNKLNNSIDNLEWCSYSHNNSYSNCQAIAGKTKRIPIVQYDLQGNKIREWESATQAGHTLNIANTCITACCRGRARKAGGYMWRYREYIRPINLK